MADKQPGFVLYGGYAPQFKMLSLEDRGRLITTIFDYHTDGNIPDSLPPIVRMAFEFIRQDLDRDSKKYREKCEVNRENGKKGGRPKNQTVNAETVRFSEKPKKPNININSNQNENSNINANTSPPTPSKGGSGEGFERFWSIYPKKTGKDAAREAYNVLSIEDADELCKLVERWKNSAEWKRENGRYIKQASKFLEEVFPERVNPPDYNEDFNEFWNEAIEAGKRRRIV